jgi:hypothetical protein
VGWTAGSDLVEPVAATRFARFGATGLSVEEPPRRELPTPPPPFEGEPAGPGLKPISGRVEPKVSFWQSTKTKSCAAILRNSHEFTARFSGTAQADRHVAGTPFTEGLAPFRLFF